MKSIIKIVKTLKPSEKQFIINIYKSKMSNDEQKRFKLLKYALDCSANINSIQELDSKIEQKTFEKFYGIKKDKTAYSHLKSRLKDDILSYLLIHDSSTKKDLSPKVKAQLECERYYKQGLLLLRRGLYLEADRKLNRALKIAIKYEIFEEIIRIQIHLRTTTGFRKGERKYKEYSTDLNYYLDEYIYCIKAKEYYERVNMSNHFNTNKNEQVIEKGQRFCDTLDKIVHENSSDNFLFYYYRLKCRHYYIIQEFEKSIELNIKLQELIVKSPSLNINSSKAGLQMELAHLQIITGNFEKAQIAAKKSVNTFRNGMINQLRAAEVLFFSYLRNQQLDKAKETIDYAMKHKQYKTKTRNQTYNSRWDFYLANVLYLLNDKKAASKLLSQNTILAKDRSGYQLGLRILDLMMRIDEKEWDVIGYNKTNFYILLKDIKKKESNVHRAQEILKIISTLSNCYGDFAETSSKVSSSLELLQRGEGNYYWDPTGYEVIRFDQWFTEKIKK